MSSQKSGAAAFVAEVSSAQIVLNTLKGLVSGKKEQHAVCEVDSKGLRFLTTDAAVACQGCATFQSKLFDVFEVEDDSRMLQFRINLAILVHCLSTLGQQVQDVVLKMAYFEKEETFSLQLLEGQVVTECKIRTLFEETDGAVVDNMPLRTAFRASPIVNRCMIAADQLKEAFSMLQELPGAATVLLLLSPSKPFFRLSTHGQLLSCMVDFPQADESLRNLQCSESKECPYRLALFQQAGKALAFAEKTFIRMNQDGSLSLQHQIVENGNKMTYVDFYLLAEVPDDSQDANGEDTQGEERAEREERVISSDSEDERPKKRSRNKKQPSNKSTKSHGSASNNTRKRVGAGRQRKKILRDDDSDDDVLDQLL